MPCHDKSENDDEGIHADDNDADIAQAPYFTRLRKRKRRQPKKGMKWDTLSDVRPRPPLHQDDVHGNNGGCLQTKPPARTAATLDEIRISSAR